MLKKRSGLFLLSSCLLIATGCGVHRFDQAEVPVISVSDDQNPVISWTPDSAYQVSVYKGEKTSDEIAKSLWKKQSANYENGVKSPVTVATTLESGKTYTVEVRRKDPKGTGDGFSNTHHTYLGRKVFKVN